MKRVRLISLLLCLMLCLTACGIGTVALQDRMPIPEDGIISARLLSQIKEENAIAVFEGASGGLTYEWTIFGSDIDRSKDIDLRVDLQPQSGSLQAALAQEEPFGFPVLLSVRLAEQWQADGAAAWQNESPVYSVSLTGTENTIVNLPVGEVLGTFLILPENTPEQPEKILVEEQPKVPVQNDNYLSSVGDTDSRVQTEQPAISQRNEAPGQLEVQPDGYLSQGRNDNDIVYGSLQVPDRPADKLPEVQSDDYLTPEQTGNNAVYGSAQSPATQSTTPTAPTLPDGYLSGTSTESGRVYSTTTGGGKDRYQTDPVPVGKPLPTEPQDQQVDTRKQYTCTFSIECATILNNLSQLAPEKLEMVPSSGVILPKQTVTFYEGESVFDVLQRLCRDKGIHMESSWTPIYNSAYIEGIHNLYEFDCGSLSGWMYRVNGWYPNYGCSRYQLAQGDVVEWRYTCDLGKDVGGKNVW